MSQSGPIADRNIFIIITIIIVNESCHFVLVSLWKKKNRSTFYTSSVMGLIWEGILDQRFNINIFLYREAAI